MWWVPLANHLTQSSAIFPSIRIELHHITEVMQRAKDAGAPEQARRVRAAVELVLNRAIRAGGKAIGNPADAAGCTPLSARASGRIIAPLILMMRRRFFRELKAKAMTSTAFAAWSFMILCASRPSEALNAQWREIDGEKKLWVIPAARMKSGKSHTVPLSDEALEILDRQATVATGDAIFPGRGGSPLSYDTFASAPARAEPPINAATPHGWRSVFRDFCGDIAKNVPWNVAEAALAHCLKGVAAAYRRRTAVEKRRKVMEDYARWLNGDGVAKVVALSDHRASRGKA